MSAAALIRIGSQFFQATMGGMCVLCLHYAATLSEPNVVRWLFLSALKWGGLATAIIYFQHK